MMAVINFETSIYWGQLSQCKTINSRSDSHYSCDDREAYGAVAAFAVLVMLCQLSFAYCVSIWREEFIDEVNTYNQIDLNSNHHQSDSPDAPQ